MYSVKETFEYTFDNVRVDALCLICMVVMAFLRCNLDLYLLQIRLILITEKFKDLMIYHILRCTGQLDLVCLHFLEKCLLDVLMKS